MRLCQKGYFSPNKGKFDDDDDDDGGGGGDDDDDDDDDDPGCTVIDSERQNRSNIQLKSEVRLVCWDLG